LVGELETVGVFVTLSVQLEAVPMHPWLGGEEFVPPTIAISIPGL